MKTNQSDRRNENWKSMNLLNKTTDKQIINNSTDSLSRVMKKNKESLKKYEKYEKYEKKEERMRKIENIV